MSEGLIAVLKLQRNAALDQLAIAADALHLASKEKADLLLRVASLEKELKGLAPVVKRRR